MLAEFINKHRLNAHFAETAKQWYIPLAEQLLVHRDGAKRPFYVGLNGCQGSGKSTLADFIQHYLAVEHGLNVVALSLDDFYLSSRQRADLALSIHPLLQTRGVPGTHDMQLAKMVLRQLAEPNAEVALPRFSKATDNPLSSAYWPMMTKPVDIVIFEGWCWGVNAQPASMLEQPVNSLEAEQDERRIWRTYVNQQLKSHYQPLYKMMDYWLMLQAPDFEHVFEWRLEQERKLAESQGVVGNKVMTTRQICDFIQHYQRLTEYALESLPQQCDQVFKLDKNRQIVVISTRKTYA